MPKKSKTKTENKKKEDKKPVESFDLTTALNTIKNPFAKEGFKLYIKSQSVDSQKEFDNLLKEFMGGKTH